MTEIVTDLSAIAARYDVLLCDVWGVIHNGETAFPAACAALARWRAERGPVVLISNSPRPAPDVIAQMEALGAPRAAWTAIVTSGDVTRALLAKRAPGPVWKIGPERDAPLYEGLGLVDGTALDAAFIACSGLVDDEVESAEDYRAVLTVAASRNLEMICANPDLVVQRGDRLIPCAGALAQLYEGLGGRVRMAGKPYAPIYEASFAASGESPDRRRVLAIGDGMPTDLAGANAAGLDALFIGGGIHGAGTVLPDGRLDEAAVSRALRAAGVTARYAMSALVWQGSRLADATG